jgi:hypothetical protein
VRHLQHPTQNGTPHYQTTRDLCNNAHCSWVCCFNGGVQHLAQQSLRFIIGH